MKKGFTLIELLAVIVILAVLALIATPIVLNIIDDSKKNATLRSSENYIKAVEFSIAKSVMENKRLNDGVYPIMSNGNICIGTLSNNTCDNELIVEVAGETPESGTVTIKSRKIDSYEFTYASGFVVLNGSISSEEIVTKLAPGLYDENDNLLISWEDLTSMDYKSIIYVNSDGDEVTEAILNVDENGALRSTYTMDDDSNYSAEYLKGKLVIDESVTSIGADAFMWCDGLTSITIPNSVTSIGSYAFVGLGLKNIIIPNGITNVGEGMFEFCYDLTSVTIPNSVTSIGSYAFNECTSLTNINYKGAEEEWNTISFGENWDLGTPSDKQIIFNYTGE